MKTTETKVQHTQGELKAFLNQYPIGEISINKDVRKRIATITWNDVTDKDEAVANAEHIVRCWNSFYPLLEALKECVGELECYDLSKESYPVLAKALAIIKAAEQTT